MADTVEPQVPTPAQRRRVLWIAVARGLSVATVLTVPVLAHDVLESAGGVVSHFPRMMSTLSALVP